MTHPEIEQREVIESYVRNRLTAEERLAFEEHFFICDQCFAQVQDMERFVAGIHYAAETGLIAPQAAPNRAGLNQMQTFFAPAWLDWLKPALALTAIIALALGAATVWLLVHQLPQLRTELARERQAQAQIQQEHQQSLQQTQAELQREREQHAELEKQLAQARTSPPTSVPSGAEPNLPLVMLEATREAATANQITVPARAKSVVLWMDPSLSTDFSSFRLVVQTPEGQPVQTIEGLRRNSYGALVVSLPAASLPGPQYRVKLYGLGGREASLVAEYKLQVRKR
jgi:anti-sigma factor RsiW